MKLQNKTRNQRIFTILLLLSLCAPLLTLINFAPTVKADDVNIAPLDAQHWGVYTSYPYPSYSILANNHIDNTVLFNGQATIRIDPHTSSDTNTARESDSLWTAISPGKHIVFSVWIKTDTNSGSTFYPQCGGRIGIDFYGSTYLTGISWAGQYVYPWQSWTEQAVSDNWVSDASGGWQHRTLDFIVPTLVHNDWADPTGNLGTMEQPGAMIPWMQAGPYDNTQTSVWFADPEIYIDPTGNTNTNITSDNTILGNNAVGTYGDTNDANYKSASQFVAGTTGTITSINAYVDRASTSGLAAAAIYADTNGLPTTLLSQSSTATVSTTMNWVNFPLQNSITVTAGTAYWIALCSDQNLHLVLVTGTGVRAHNQNTFSSGFTNPFGTIYAPLDPTGAMSTYSQINPASQPTPTLPPGNNPIVPAGTFIIQTPETPDGSTSYFNIVYPSNSAFKIQDPINNINTTFTVTSGSLNAATNLNVTTSGGLFYIIPTTSGTFTVASTSPTFSISVNGVNTPSNSLNFNQGVAYLILWQYTSQTQPPPVIIGAHSSILYLRSDTYTSNTKTAYGLATTDTTIPQTINTYSATATQIIYGFRVWIIHTKGAATELTNILPIAQMTRTTTGSGMQNATWLAPATPLILGKDALEIGLYVSLDGGATWTSQANYITQPIISAELLQQTWTFNLYTTWDSAAKTGSFSFGDRTYNSNINGVGEQTPSYTDLQTYRFINGDFIGFMISTYTYQIGVAAYLLILLIPCTTLYLRHRNFGPVLIMFAIFGGPGGIIWLFIPAFAATAVDIFLVIGAAFIVWKLIR